MSGIIIVDDHAMMRNGLSSWLEKNTSWNNIRLADSVESAKTLIKTELPEICIIDVQIGDEDGFSLLNFITKEYKYNNEFEIKKFYKKNTLQEQFYPQSGR